MERRTLVIIYKLLNSRHISEEELITEILNSFNKNNDGKPYDGKLSRTVWVGGKSNYEDYVKYNFSK